MPHKLHFSTFLRLLASTTADRMRTIEKYAEPGGFDYWKTLRSAITQYTLGTLDRNGVERYISANAGGNSEKNTLDRFNLVADWMGRQTGQGYAPSQGLWTSPNELFSVFVEPEIGLVSSSRDRVVACYPTNSPPLTRDCAGSGIVLLNRHFGEGFNGSLEVYDVKRNRCHRTPTNLSARQLDADIADIERHFHAIL